MLRAILLLLACQLGGEAIHRLTGLALPGAVIGMVLLLAWLALVPRERPTLAAVSGWLTAHLAVMFVPAAVGLIDEGAVLSRYGLALVAATVASTVLTLAVTALVFRWALRFVADGDDA
ncbi:MAG TPA: CidA/LrgA family protein [Novosphingobium sp.]|nr:CidA/LrgA family protein [Novosphingobium sp.]